jgi:hypothetical protein
VLTEASLPGRGFRAEVCQAWEASTARAATRRCVLRTGIVLDTSAGAFPPLLRFARLLGSQLGNGQQWLPWIHNADVTHLSSARRPLPVGMGRNGRLLSVFVCLWQKRELARGVTASGVPNAGNSERQRPHGRGHSGCLWYVDGSDSPTLVVSRPPDANRGGDAWEPETTGMGNAPSWRRGEPPQLQAPGFSYGVVDRAFSSHSSL